MKLGDRVALIVYGEIVADDYGGGWLINLDQLNDDEVTKAIVGVQEIHIRKDYPMLEIPIGDLATPRPSSRGEFAI